MSSATKLYALSISHPSRSAILMLRHKGIEHDVVNLPSGSQPVALRALGFRRGTVPALRIDGRRAQGSLTISRALEEIQPEPPLFPADPELRAAVEQAEAWGEADYQPVPRRFFRWSLANDFGSRRSFAELTEMPLPGLTARTSQPLAAYFARVAGADTDQVRADLAALPSQLDRIDRLIAEGVIGGEQPNAADFQIATTTRVLAGFPQLRRLVEDRPAAEQAMRIAPDFATRDFGIRLPEELFPS